jgi:hypothetical protein
MVEGQAVKREVAGVAGSEAGKETLCDLSYELRQIDWFSFHSRSLVAFLATITSNFVWPSLMALMMPCFVEGSLPF